MIDKMQKRAYSQEKQNIKKPLAPKELCPNCWGRQEYGGNFYTAFKNNINTKVSELKKGWIRNYAEANLKSSKLVSNNSKRTCKVCFEIYNQDSMKKAL